MYRLDDYLFARLVLISHNDSPNLSANTPPGRPPSDKEWEEDNEISERCVIRWLIGLIDTIAFLGNTATLYMSCLNCIVPARGRVDWRRNFIKIG